MSSSPATMGEADRRLTKHGFPKGFRFVPTHLELITILSYCIQGRPLHPKVAAIFHDLAILDYHPEELHDLYERDKEHRYIYFLSRRQLQAGAGGGSGPAAAHKKRQRGGAGDEDDSDNEPRPVRLAKGGGWKPSGGGHVLHWPKDKGGFVAGKMVTMVFYDHRGGEQVKSHWGMHEFTVPLEPRQPSKPTKSTRVRMPLHDLALYRLYKLKSDMESDDGAGAGSNNLQTLANVPAANAGHFSAPCPAGQPSLSSSFGIFAGRNQPLAGAGASTSRTPPPPQLQQHRTPNAGHPQYYNHHNHQYGFGAAPARYAHQQQVHTMTTMPPAYGAAGMPGRQLPFQLARPLGMGLPGPFAGPPPAQMPVLPTAAHAAASHQHAPYAGAGQDASHSGATRSPPLAAPVAMPALAAEIPPMAEGLPPMVEEIPADDNDGTGMKDWDLDMGIYENCLFTWDELCPTSDEPPPPTQQGDDS